MGNLVPVEEISIPLLADILGIDNCTLYNSLSYL